MQMKWFKSENTDDSDDFYRKNDITFSGISLLKGSVNIYTHIISYKALHPMHTVLGTCEEVYITTTFFKKVK